MTNYSKARDEYLESEILSAGPVRRVQLLYMGALEAIGKARVALAAKDIPTRAAQVNKAFDILTELALSLDHTRGAPVTRELIELYDYAQRCLIEGNASQTVQPFANAERVLKTVLEGWKSIPEIETGSVVPPVPNAHVAFDYGAGDNVGAGRVTSCLDQVG